MQRADCEAHSSLRISALPMTMLLADRFSSSSAPATAATPLGGLAVQTSSQISMWKVKGAAPSARNSRSRPNGAVVPAMLISAPTTPEPDEKCRRS
jgi:hypothetical protein